MVLLKKKELVEFCRDESLSTAGSKVELRDRIGCFLDTGEKKKLAFKKRVKTDVGTITEESEIEDSFVCSEKHRDFFADNKGNLLKKRFECWKYKKGQKVRNQYEKNDLIILIV